MDTSIKIKNPYEVLNVDRKALDDEIKRAYRQLALRYHPDKLTNVTSAERAEAKDKFQDIAKSYQILSNPNKRKIYDEEGDRGIIMMERLGEETYMRIRRFGPVVKGILIFIGIATCGFCCCFGCCFCCCCFCCGLCKPKIDEDLQIFRMEEGDDEGGSQQTYVDSSTVVIVSEQGTTAVTTTVTTTRNNEDTVNRHDSSVLMDQHSSQQYGTMDSS